MKINIVERKLNAFSQKERITTGKLMMLASGGIIVLIIIDSVKKGAPVSTDLFFLRMFGITGAYVLFLLGRYSLHFSRKII